MNRYQPTGRKLDRLDARIDQLPRPVAVPFQSLDLTHPVERFSTLAKLDEWAKVLGRVLDPPAETELAELRPIVAATEQPPPTDWERPTSGPLADELADLDRHLAELGGVPDDDGPRMHDPEMLEVFDRETLRWSCSWITLDNRPGAAESQALHRWYNDPANLDGLAARLGYSTSPRPRP